ALCGRRPTSQLLVVEHQSASSKSTLTSKRLPAKSLISPPCRTGFYAPPDKLLTKTLRSSARTWKSLKCRSPQALPRRRVCLYGFESCLPSFENVVCDRNLQIVECIGLLC